MRSKSFLQRLNGSQRWGTCVLTVLAGTALAPYASAQSAVHPCGSLANALGPYDYRVNKESLATVEQYHFTPNVEALVSGNSGSLAGELDYTLRAFPNHHRALLAMAKLAEREKSPQAKGAPRSVDCYFDRAVRFKPDDNVARMFYAQWLRKHGREADARAQLNVVAERAGDNPFTHYNVGLLYLDMKAYDVALVHAHKAMELGLPRTELRDQLRAAGKWTEPDGTASGVGAASAAASSASN